jgi:DNA-directed RNA polymerase subunit RPC12/RpoP
MFYLKKHELEPIHTYTGKGYELDIYIPSKKIAIEFDGYFWHKNKVRKDMEKNLKCKEDGIKLYRIREGLLSLEDSSIDYVIQKDHKDLSKTIELILSEITESIVDVDLERDALSIESLREYAEKENSILFTNPKLASEWNYSKNGKLKPENFLVNSNKKVWWKCIKGHEWQAKIYSRNSGNGCPYCSGWYVIEGENDLSTSNPALIKEWNYEKNGDLTPEKFTANSGQKVWWRCREGHEWQTTIAHRNRGYGCPYCSGKYAIEGENDLQTINPDLAKEWNYEKNIELTPSDVLPNSGIKVWWKCVNGHEWQATLNHRNHGRGCPYCAGKRVSKGFNDLQTINPTLIDEWNYEKNGSLKPDSVTKSCNKKIWWKCKWGHEWQATINDRSSGRGCPYCTSRIVLAGYNDLQTIHPALAIEWNYEKNIGQTPAEVMPNSNKKVWWKCKTCSYEWESIIANRSKGHGCPQCARNKRRKN